ncbi:hypothetical protein ACFL6B_03790 [Thermodesulfobacteriota bacterium]
MLETLAVGYAFYKLVQLITAEDNNSKSNKSSSQRRGYEKARGNLRQAKRSSRPKDIPLNPNR